ncbi:unnamed protein product, partial [Iphiclides podalirius]
MELGPRGARGARGAGDNGGAISDGNARHCAPPECRECTIGLQFERRVAKSESGRNATPHLSRDVKVGRLIEFRYL